MSRETKDQLKRRYQALEEASWEYWRQMNRAIVQAGGTLHSVTMADGSVIERATLNGIAFDRRPPAWVAEEKLAAEENASK